ncbi:ABC transporter ATP-binding protein [Arthrobacter sp. MYb213]|uniref:ABC transporter ATP-binding protein n=1 Tax=Arthrobacter sp. MYb213 TaxID=1848595 RepID=UPI0015E3AE97|nr:ABC transporter ATP-binding protein [Arthrobacter sp. MYb213]
MEIQKNSFTGKSTVLALEIERFRYSGAESDTLQSVDLELAPGSLTVIVGDSGSGKSTLGALLAGMLPRPAADECRGSINLAGQRVQYSAQDSPRIDVAGWAKHVGLLPQEAGHYLSRIREIVAEELVFSLENEGATREQMHQQISTLSQRFSLGHLLKRDPAKLSGGQERLVALAALSVSDPSVMVLDEPLAGLDAEATVTVTEMIARLRSGGTALLVLSRTAGPWTASADAVWTLANGHLHKANGASIERNAAATAVQRSPIATDGRTLLEFSGVKLGYPKSEEPAVQGLDLQVRAGECVALAGANGSGKTTVLKAAAGLLKPSSGTIQVSAETGLLLQNPSDQLFERTVLREVTFGLPKKSAARAKVPEILAQLGLSSDADSHPYELPASARRLVALATVLVREPKILLLDEPTEALDIWGVAALRRVIDSVLAHGGAVLFSSHDQNFMDQIADRVQLMSG